MEVNTSFLPTVYILIWTVKSDDFEIDFNFQYVFHLHKDLQENKVNVELDDIPVNVLCLPKNLFAVGVELSQVDRIVAWAEGLLHCLSLLYDYILI